MSFAARLLGWLVIAVAMIAVQSRGVARGFLCHCTGVTVTVAESACSDHCHPGHAHGDGCAAEAPVPLPDHSHDHEVQLVSVEAVTAAPVAVIASVSFHAGLPSVALRPLAGPASRPPVPVEPDPSPPPALRLLRSIVLLL